MIEIAPSILSADFARLGEEIQRVERAGADVIHVDVMDGHFVPNLTIGPPVVRALDRATTLPLDCHLMVAEADDWIDGFVEAGAARITVHVEACPHLHRTLARIRDAGCLAGVSLNPATPLGSVEEVLPEVDQLLIMSVNPGFGGQRFIPRCLDKVERAARRLGEIGSQAIVQVDGGVDAGTIGDLVRAGARSLVAGNAVFGQPDAGAAVRALRAAAEAAER
jgi:ribulose-phosphate 3-epimerase